jgi:GDPmannose 4,6-dehydratase
MSGATVARAMITGITGQDGLYLAELLVSKGYDVFGVIRGQDNPKYDLVRTTVPEVTLLKTDITDLSGMIRAMETSEPDEVYNLAAISFVPYSWENPALTSDITAKGVLNVLEASRIWSDRRGQSVRFYQASSSEMFGRVQQVPQVETTMLWPRSPYGAAKAYGHHITVNYRESYGMHASSGILFNHESPRRGPEFVTRKVTRAAARIALGLQAELRLGNLEAERDWGYAGDFVDAMWRMLQQDIPDDYIIATGITHTIRELLDAAFSEVGINDWTEYVIQDPKYVRPAEVDKLVGDSSKARNKLGWMPTVGFAELIAMMVKSDLQEQEQLSARRVPTPA